MTYLHLHQIRKSWKYENKHIMLDTSEEDLSSSYRDTQNNDTEDDSSTNGSASKQNLFIL